MDHGTWTGRLDHSAIISLISHQMRPLIQANFLRLLTDYTVTSIKHNYTIMRSISVNMVKVKTWVRDLNSHGNNLQFPVVNTP